MWLLYLLFRNTAKITHTNTFLPLLSSSTEKAQEKACLFYIQWSIMSVATIKDTIKKQKPINIVYHGKKKKNK